MKKKLLCLLVILLIIGGIIAFFVLRDKDDKEEVEMITIKFDVDGGEPVDKMEVEKGSKVELPTTVKDGYNFVGWYDKDDNKVEDKTKFKKDTTLKAKWEEIPEDVKTMEVSFNTNGGNSIKTVTMECDKGITLPANPTKAGYTFTGWTLDGKAVKKGDKLECKNVTLVANWKKNEEKKPDPKPEPTPEPKPEPKVSYTCSEGTLDGTKCVITKDANAACSGERVFDYNGKCVTINYSVRQDSKASCGTTTVHTGVGHTEQVQGEIFKMGTNYCFFKIVEDSYENNQANCTSRGHKWNSINSKCYYYRGDANQFVTNTCDHLNGYALITDPNSYQGVNGLNGGCFPVKDKTYSCESGYTLNGTKCTKTINATKVEG